MRKLILAAFAVAFTFAFASIVFTALLGYSGTTTDQLCSDWYGIVLTPVRFAASKRGCLAWVGCCS